MATETFPSSKSWFSGLAIWGTVILIAAVLPFEAPAPMFWLGKLALILFCLLTVGLLLWIWFGTHYRISENLLFYKSGPISGNIPISQIREIHLNEYLWSGLRPALGMKGMVVYYNKWDEIYFSPTEKERFVQLLKQVNPEIVVK